MNSTATTAPPDGWWYQQAAETKGPTTAEELRTLLARGTVHLGTMVWHQAFGEAWKRLDQTDLVPPSPPRMTPPPISVGDGTWSKIFAQFDDPNGSQVKWSFLGFFIGPLYYFYLGMWRKALVIIGFAMGLSVALSVLDDLLGAPQLQRVTALAVGATCGVLVFRDYWKLKRFGERMWPQLIIFERPWAIVLLLLAPVVAVGVIVAFESSEPTARAASSRPPTAPHLQRAAQGDLKESWDTTDRQQADPRDRAAKNCKKFLQDTFNGSATNAYDPDTNYAYEINFQPGTLNRDTKFFGNHQYLFFSAQLQKNVNGRWNGESSDLPQQVCVLDDAFNVMGMENNVRDGLP